MTALEPTGALRVQGSECKERQASRERDTSTNLPEQDGA